jgi:predicted phage-related endonuclease
MTHQNKSEVELSSVAIVALTKFAEAKKAKAQAEKAIREAEAILRDELAEASVGTVSGVAAVKVVASHNSHIDKEGLKVAFPEVYEQYLNVTNYTYLKAV